MKQLLLFLLFISYSWALLVPPEDAMKQSFQSTTVIKKSMILTKKDLVKVQKLAQTKLPTKLFRLYTAKNGSQTTGFGILLSQKVRSKSTAVLYMVDPTGKLKNIEIIAFNEPFEYLPTKPWMAQFSEKKTNRFVPNENVTMITGATLSANAIINIANIAKAIWMVKLAK